MKRKLYTVVTFARINTRRYFRDKTAIFFTVAFPLIFLFVFGGLFGNSSNGVSFKVALLNESSTQASKDIAKNMNDGKILKVNSEVTNLDEAKQRMNRGEIDATIVLPKDFGEVKQGTDYPSGQAQILYSQNNTQAGQTLQSVLQGEFKAVNAKLVDNKEPFTVTSQQTNDQSLSSFDYTFTGLLGFSIMGMGIFGPINIFPELKKQGILRRFHTTPIRVWQYFMSTMITQAATGLFAIAILFAVAIGVFHLKVVGNIFELGIYIVLGIMMILGIGLALGGWAKNERQAAPLSNIVVFPMMFLSGTFFPRFLMPEWLQTASSFLPLTPVIDGLRMIATEGKHLTDPAVLPLLGLMGLWGIVIYAIAFRVFRWE
jgi:ABC-2 type transport system permease protein